MRFDILALCGLVLAAVKLCEASKDQFSLKERIQQSLESLLEMEAKGVQNCQNKCDKSFNRFAYEIATTGGANVETFEFRACVRGCEQCSKDRANNASADNCFRMCKNFDWTTNSIVKGVIEPDKACIGGCVINTCQVICMGGTTDSTITDANKKFFYPNGGCSIKTQPYSQDLEYVPFNSPNNGQGGSQDVARCCANALSLCQYVGDTNSANYRQLLSVTQRSCSQFVSSGARQDICQFFNQARNCGRAAR